MNVDDYLQVMPGVDCDRATCLVCVQDFNDYDVAKEHFIRDHLNGGVPGATGHEQQKKKKKGGGGGGGGNTGSPTVPYDPKTCPLCMKVYKNMASIKTHFFKWHPGHWPKYKPILKNQVAGSDSPAAQKIDESMIIPVESYEDEKLHPEEHLAAIENMVEK